MDDLVATPKETKKAIEQGIRQALLELGSATKAEISGKLSISFPTISKFLARMEESGEIMTLGLGESSGGRRAIRYSYNPEYRLGLALFLEKEETQYMIFDSRGETKEKGRTSTSLTKDAGSLAEQAGKILSKYPNIGSIAIGVPGAVRLGRIVLIPDYPQLQNVDLKGDFEQRFGIPVVVENDMNAAVLGYSRIRFPVHEQRRQTLVYLYFGQNGPGAGMLINGEVVRGSTYFSGEVSFVPLHDDRNFGQAMFDVRGPGGIRHLSEATIDSVSRLVASLAAILNPHEIVFGEDEVTNRQLRRIALGSADYIPEAHLPKLSLSDRDDDYLTGLRELGLDLLMEGATINN
ncbi:ROK family protein [Paenibacillus sp. LHD-117]|uniref:ROK family transcriptional regulator n=1 Tax=Paenibacillus sp. LHD-117 TaxID=3071412 RepID=UPI0027E0DF32|nr:ROK family protein [Paenibacillus sp. LHD-117]MDQ6421726.1 ROK family protein [Paenibacillus sp. LHD-117]